MRRSATFRLLAFALLALVVSIALSACGGQTKVGPTTTRPPDSAVGGRNAAQRSCGRLSPRAVSYSHVIWLWMENHSYDEVIGSKSAPYLNSLAAACGVATNYHNITHPSLPNYIAATSGLDGRALNPFFDDCDPSQTCSTAAKSIFADTHRWRAYEESMPAPCARQDSGDYAVRHNPPPFYTTLVGCSRHDRPLGELPRDLARNALPAFSFITPNLCHDTHDCTVDVGDRWLAREVPEILNSRQYRAGTVALFITWDEGEGGSATDCATNQRDIGCHVAMVIISPSTPSGRRSARVFNHYSLLRTTEDLLGLAPLGKARAASSMATTFGL